MSLGLIASIHVAAFVALRYGDPNVIRRAPSVPLVVELLPLTPPPPERKPVALPTKQERASVPVPQHIVAPVPIMTVPPAPVVLVTTPRPEPGPGPGPPLPGRVEETRSAPPRATETMVDLDTRLISAVPPRYPVEARRRRETGTVILLVLVDEQGRVSAISVATSSGVERLDKAALTAVRRWRWSPTIIAGQPSLVRGLVRIPFQLAAS